jgi:hypothetical protein
MDFGMHFCVVITSFLSASGLSLIISKPKTIVVQY